MSARKGEGGELTETQKRQLAYWTAFREYVQGRRSILKPQKPFPQNWTMFSVGRSNFYLCAIVNFANKWLGCYLAIAGPDAKPHYYLLEQAREDVEREFGESLEWREMPTRKESHVRPRNLEADPGAEEDWPRQHDWLCKKLESLHSVFASRIRELDASEYRPEGDG